MFSAEANQTNQDYAALSPDTVIGAIESVKLVPNGQVLALNSYENRVYRIGIDEEGAVVVKFYRPERWTDEQILEEHTFSEELVEADLPIVKPLTFDGKTLLNFRGFRFAIYPLQGGRAPEFDNPENLRTMGRFLARIHAVGKAKRFEHRPSINTQNFGHDSAAIIAESFIPDSLKEAYSTLSKDLLDVVDNRLQSSQAIQIRTHGDCHSGNVLWRDDAPHFVDFDDARTAPAVQDLWMLLSGSREEQEVQLSKVVEGYEEFGFFNTEELLIVEALRSLRIMHYAAWLARRWIDPAFPKAFPWFNTERYWGEHILELREQLAAMQEPPLRLI